MIEQCQSCGPGLCWLCEIEETPCDACGAEKGEPCRPGCLGYAIEHDKLTENGV